MTYLQFLVYLFAPWLLAALVMWFASARRSAQAASLFRGALALLALSVFAVLYTTPWDSWMIQKRVWWYPRGKVVGTVFSVPLEEYMFMVGLTLLAGCCTLSLVIRHPSPRVISPRPATRIAGGAFWLTVSVSGVLLILTRHDSLYLGSMLAWFGIPLALQETFGADLMRSIRALRLVAPALTVLVSAAEIVALHADIWHVSSTRTIGIRIDSMPVEEGIFYFLVTLLVVNTIDVVTHPVAGERLRALKSVVLRSPNRIHATAFVEQDRA